MTKSKRITFTVDWDIYCYAVEEAARRKISLGQMFRWITRDGVVYRKELEAKYRRLAMEEGKYGR